MEKLYSLEVLCQCNEWQAQALNDALIEAAEKLDLHIVATVQQVPDDDQD